MENTMSPADVIALARDNRDDFMEGNGLIILILFFLMFGGGFGGFGFGRNNGVTQDQLQYGFDTQTIVNKLDSITAAQAANAVDNVQMFNTVNTGILTSTADINKNINDLAHQMEQCCCDLKTQMLQDKYEATQYQLEQANTAVANAVQTQNILNALGSYYARPSVNPYTCYNALPSNGCGCIS